MGGVGPASGSSVPRGVADVPHVAALAGERLEPKCPGESLLWIPGPCGLIVGYSSLSFPAAWWLASEGSVPGGNTQ